MNTKEDYKIPKHITDRSTLEILIENMKKMDTEQQQTKPQNMIFIFKLVILFLLLVQEDSNKHFNSMKLIYELLNLKTQNKFDYSTEIMIFSSLLYNCSPKRYRLLRDRRNIILPNYSSLSTYINPLIEQHDNFLMYIKNRFKLLVQKDTIVSLFVDEIYLKPYFYYKGGKYCWLI